MFGKITSRLFYRYFFSGSFFVVNICKLKSIAEHFKKSKSHIIVTKILHFFLFFSCAHSLGSFLVMGCLLCPRARSTFIIEAKCFPLKESRYNMNDWKWEKVGRQSRACRALESRGLDFELERMGENLQALAC